MHITLETDYAIRIVDTLGKESLKGDNGIKSCIDAGTISESTDVPLRFALKILRKLVSGGLVKSYKGVYGGYRLIKPVKEISLYDVIEIVEGEYRFSRCLSEGYSCNCSADGLPCNYRQAFSDVSEIVKEYLKKQTFDKLIKP
ncbi:MAG TPA: Rrf2 family transcriptional regulator [Ruminococcaceae bacterium]|nr:Rrf2 family transcriptional regulator [Oscillospiraceae bacterium]